MTEPHVPQDLEERLIRTLGARVDDLHARPDLLTAAKDRAGRRRRRTTGTAVLAAAAVVAGVVISAAVVSSDGQVTPAAPTGTPTTTTRSSAVPPAQLPPGTLTVGLGDIAVSVPDSWSIVGPGDECAPIKLDRVIAASGLCRDGRSGQLNTSVVLAPLDSPDGRDVEAEIDEVSKGTSFGPEELNDLTVESSGGVCAGSGSGPPDCYIDLVIRDAGIVVRVRARSFEAADEIAATVRSVPQGYTLVPDLGDLARELPPVGVVADRLGTAGLEVDGEPSGYAQATDPASATIVPIGSAVVLTTTPYRKGPPPAATSDQVDGSWSVSVVGVTDVDGPFPTMTLQRGEMTADDGCNQIGGSYDTSGDDLVFDSDSIESTAVGCDLTTALLDRLLRVRHVSFRSDGLYLHADNWEIILVLRSS